MFASSPQGDPGCGGCTLQDPGVGAGSSRTRSSRLGAPSTGLPRGGRMISRNTCMCSVALCSSIATPWRLVVVGFIDGSGSIGLITVTRRQRYAQASRTTPVAAKSKAMSAANPVSTSLSVAVSGAEAQLVSNHRVCRQLPVRPPPGLVRLRDDDRADDVRLCRPPSDRLALSAT